MRGPSGTRCRHERSQHGSWRAEPALAAKPGGCLSSAARPQLKFARHGGRCQAQCRPMSGGAAARRMVQAGAIFAWQPTVNWQSAARMPWMQQQNCRNLPGSALRSDTARDLQGGVASLVRMRVIAGARGELMQPIHWTRIRESSECVVWKCGVDIGVAMNSANRWSLGNCVPN